MTHHQLRQSLDFSYKLIIGNLAKQVSDIATAHGLATDQQERKRLEQLRLEAFQAQRAIQAVQDTFKERSHGTDTSEH